jgi:hypothetical protein
MFSFSVDSLKLLVFSMAWLSIEYVPRILKAGLLFAKGEIPRNIQYTARGGSLLIHETNGSLRCS